jgi:hypothetical protein
MNKTSVDVGKTITQLQDLKPGKLYIYSRVGRTRGTGVPALYLKEEYCEVTYAWVHRFEIKGVSLIFGPREIERYFTNIDTT